MIPIKNVTKLTVVDFILCVVSLAVAAISHPFKPLARLWPYILLLISFIGFLFWNGGVVLGTSVLSLHTPNPSLTHQATNPAT